MASKRVSDIIIDEGFTVVDSLNASDVESLSTFKSAVRELMVGDDFRALQTTGYARALVFLRSVDMLDGAVIKRLNDGGGKWVVKGVKRGFVWPVVEVLDASRGKVKGDEVREWLGHEDVMRVCRRLFRDGDGKRVGKIGKAFEELGWEEETWLAREWGEKLRWNREEGVKLFKGLGHKGEWGKILEVWTEERPMLPHVYAACCRALGRGGPSVLSDPRYSLLKEEVEGMIELEEDRWGERNVGLVREAWEAVEGRGGEGKDETKGKNIPNLVNMGPSCGVNR
ncbi:hypothetical protein TrCOL_g10310 [Triparma columacea]|uniref:Uncharacterized protein n=1 Tax=Triparma columacea TaxID=722753 RepID=A0A9W7FVE7_9STRA|nr:hypothetical protein TrCOL_g10310 [Triparma columacea]